MWALLLGCQPDPVLAPVALVPRPVTVAESDGVFVLPDAPRLQADGEAVAVAERLAADLPSFEAEVVDRRGDVELEIDAALGPGAYTLDVDRAGVRIVGGDADGLYWGTQTLRQLLPAATIAGEPLDAPVGVPFVQITDAPRFPWRGYMLDVARHFFGVDEVKRQIDAMALHKLDRLHLHLTDDQGWRIEIQSWPDLTAIGGAYEVGGGRGGFYTQDEFGEIVAYAAERHIVVVPEVDFPAHVTAALASYPELNESGVAADLYLDEPVIAAPLWLDGPSTKPFVADVIAEVAAITPGPWLHVGGDEAVDIETADYDAFVVWMQGEVEGAGKTMIGWDEVGPAGLTAPFVAQYWYDPDNARAGVAGGGQMIASPFQHAYLDMVHDADAEYGQVWGGAVGVQRAYGWDPVLSGVDEADVIGVEGALWTELINSRLRIDYMTWPREAALAEVGWSMTTDWDDFEPRLAAHGERLEALGIGFYASPEVDW